MLTSKLVTVIAVVVAWGLLSMPAALAWKSKKINFFLHDRLLAPVNPSAFFILPPLAGIPKVITPDLPYFGAVAVFDDSITAHPEEDSLEIARARGFYIFDQNSTSGAGLEFTFTAEFNKASGYEGSTLGFKGFDRILAPVREIAIVGGTGKFRLARGWAVITTYSLTDVGTATLNFTAHFYYGI